MSCARMSEPTDMPFGLWTPVGPMNHVLFGVRPPKEGATFGIMGRAPLKSTGNIRREPKLFAYSLAELSMGWVDP